MKVEVLLKELKEKNVSLSVRDGKLLCKLPESGVDKNLMDLLKMHKEEIIELFYSKEHFKKYQPIPKAPKMDSYPLSPAQNRIWIMSNLEGGSVAYNIVSAGKLTGDLNCNVFEESFRKIIQKHEILRTSFEPDEQSLEIRQFIKSEEDINFSIEYLDFSSHKESFQKVENYLHEINSEPFDLENTPLFRASLIKLGEQEHAFFFIIHHIISDGWSLEITVAELIQSYNDLINGKKKELTPISIQYKDYSVWLQEELVKENYEKSEKYWLNVFKEEAEVLDLPSNKKRPAIQTFNGNCLYHSFSSKFTNDLKVFSEQNNVTLFTTLMAGVKYLLHRYSGQNDITVGTPIAARVHPDLKDQLGLYVNTLAVRTQFDHGISFNDLLQIENKNLLDANKHQMYAFAELVNKLGLKRDLSRSPLFDVFVVFQNQSKLKFGNESGGMKGISFEQYDFEMKTSQFDISFYFSETNDQLNLKTEYNIDIYEEEFIKRIFEHFENLFSQVIEKKDVEHSEIDIISIDERQKILNFSSGDSQDYPKNKTIIDLFEEQVSAAPDKVALVFGDVEISYTELNEITSTFANYILQNYKIEVEDLIGLELERDEWLVIAIIAILKTGAAYVPIDINLPKERKDYIISDSKCKLLIDKTVIEEFKQTEPNTSKSEVKVDLKPNNLCYVIYTSGSTGKPKGVLVEHGTSVAFLQNLETKFGFVNHKSIAATSNVVFDISFLELISSLCTGKKVVLFSKSELSSSKEFVKKLHSSKAEILQLTPSRFSLIQDLLLNNPSPYLKLVLIGGEAFPKTLFENKNSFNGIRFLNVYGPTETTIWSTVLDVNNSDVLSIGKPLLNEKIYIVSDQMQLQPLGVVGELCIGGAEVTRGYLNRDELTNEKFVENPFMDGGRLYKTGDLAKWLPNGDLEFLGRSDNQVKVRGNRIELSEIEHRVLKYSKAISNAVILIKEIKGEDTMIAYFSSKEEIDKSLLRKYLTNHLPDYMIPNYFVKMDSFPLNTSGKVDKKALPEVTENDIIKKKYVAPSTDLEKEIALIWQEVLDVKKVGATDDFFELGGHSLIVVKMLSKVNKLYSTNIDFTSLYNVRNIIELANLVENENWGKQHLNTDKIVDKILI